jgi:8-oxo-dGTP pyrophosphatase MutT (NUDIX family)
VTGSDESPHAAARRELSEELGLDRPLGGLLAVDWVPATPERTEGLILVFDGGPLTPIDTAAIQLPADELAAWRFAALDQLPGRITACLVARTTGETAYLEDGTPLR